MTDAETGRFFQNMQEKVNSISTELLFFTLELNRIADAELEKINKTIADKGSVVSDKDGLGGDGGAGH